MGKYAVDFAAEAVRLEYALVTVCRRGSNRNAGARRGGRWPNRHPTRDSSPKI